MRIVTMAVMVLAAAGCGRSGLPPFDPDVQTGLLARWNAAVDATHTSIDFHWTELQDFPHPTFRMGSSEAYSQFAAVLVRFFQTDGNLMFLEDNELLDMSFDSGPAVTMPTTVTLRGLARDMMSSSLVDDADKTELGAICFEIRCTTN
jgi:hypothetical protein